MIKIIEGNLFYSDARIIAHQVNCQGKMGAGVALQIRRKYPNVYNEYVKACKDRSETMLGKIQVVPVNSQWNGYHSGSLLIPKYERFICNMFAQNNYGHDYNHVQYTNVEALEKCMKELWCVVHAKNGNFGDKIAMPYKIGCCRGGADWNIVYEMIEEIFTNDCEVELWKLDK